MLIAPNSTKSQRKCETLRDLHDAYSSRFSWTTSVDNYRRLFPREAC